MAKQQFGWRGQKKISSEEQAFLETQIKELETSILALQKGGMAVPPFLTDKLATLKSKLNPNKFNAKKIVYNGIEYDSTREAGFAKLLDSMNVKYQYQAEVTLQEAFSVDGEKIQDICLTVDFLVESEYFVDVKGYITQDFAIKWKMLKNKFRETRKYFLVKNDSDAKKILELIKTNTWRNILNL